MAVGEDEQPLKIGGGDTICEFQLECGHCCRRVGCDRDGENHHLLECRKQCEKLCANGHRKCSRFCFQPCDPCIKICAKKLPCGHRISCPCHQEVDEYDCVKPICKKRCGPRPQPVIPATLHKPAESQTKAAQISKNVGPATVLPDTANVLPATATMLPDTANVLPATATMFPDTANVLPATATMLPDTANVLPATATVLPDTANLRAGLFTQDPSLRTSGICRIIRIPGFPPVEPVYSVNTASATANVLAELRPSLEASATRRIIRIPGLPLRAPVYSVKTAATANVLAGLGPSLEASATRRVIPLLPLGPPLDKKVLVGPKPIKCRRTCRFAHVCGEFHNVNDRCPPCKRVVIKEFDNCEHEIRSICGAHVDVRFELCKKRCGRLLSCDHPCEKLCWETCGSCRVMVKYVYPECKHSISVFCSTLLVGVPECSRHPVIRPPSPRRRSPVPFIRDGKKVLSGFELALHDLEKQLGL